jgi:ABC-2 type transport system ATP-binding protein
VGPNGAGKSTLLRLLATYLFPSSGRLRVEGLDVVERPVEVRRRIGYLPGDTPLYHGMRTDQFLAFLGRAHGLRGAALRDRIAWVLDACALDDAVSKRIRVCSTGYRKRIGLAAALIHDPRVILLDEPTHGLDPLQVLAFRDLLERLRPGRTILVSSHVISEIAQVADRLLLIHDGALLADGTLTELYRRAAVAEGDLQALFVRTVRDCEQRRVEEARDA